MESAGRLKRTFSTRQFGKPHVCANAVFEDLRNLYPYRVEHTFISLVELRRACPCPSLSLLFISVSLTGLFYCEIIFIRFRICANALYFVTLSDVMLYSTLFYFFKYLSFFQTVLLYLIKLFRIIRVRTFYILNNRSTLIILYTVNK